MTTSAAAEVLELHDRQMDNENELHRCVWHALKCSIMDYRRLTTAE